MMVGADVWQRDNHGFRDCFCISRPDLGYFANVL